jgi:hypothetical protein
MDFFEDFGVVSVTFVAMDAFFTEEGRSFSHNKNNNSPRI